MNSDDPYFALRPQPPTPDDEICHCHRIRPVKLMYALTNNPIHCLDCNLEILVDVLTFPLQLVDDLVAWRNTYAVIYQRWLDSNVDDGWAAHQLTDIQSAVNIHGLRVRAAVAPLRACYYWYFQDQADEHFAPRQHCPHCDEAFVRYTNGIFLQLICERCKIVTVG